MSVQLRQIAYGNLVQIADSIETGRLAPPFTSFSLSRELPSEQCNHIALELNQLHESGMRIHHLVYLLRAIAEERLDSQKGTPVLELVWSGPESPGSESRDTGVLVAELFAAAEKSVLVAGFAVAQGKRVFRALSDRMSDLPSLKVRMFLNVSRPYRDLTTEAELVKRFADGFIANEWPGSRLPEIYYDRRALAADAPKRASLHAKCVVVDERKTLVTSANFTDAAQRRNIEAGIFVVDSDLARSLLRQFDALIGNGLLRQVPGLR
jgi:phosphatidylserine/phosphatidylglycerophosphate/cardiolipin synthase-like enzyme